MAPPRSLEPVVQKVAEDFAADLKRTIESALPAGSLVDFVLRASTAAGGETLAAVRSTGTGIVLTVDGVPTLRLVATYDMALSPTSAFPAVMRSAVKVFYTGRNRPLLGLDYIRNPNDSTIPSAHYNVYTDRRDFTRALVRGGARRRGRNHRRKILRGKVLGLGDVHLPVGGHRFRPCIEDILELLIVEFGIDCQPDALASLTEGRRVWRQAQLRAAVSDDPYSAMAELTHLGFMFDHVPSGLVERKDRTGKM